MPTTKVSKRKYISYLLRFAVAGTALYLAFRGENLKQLTDVLLGLNLLVVAATLGIYILSQLIFVLRWYLLLRVQDIRIGFGPAVRLHFLGLFYNNCLPGAVGGDLIRAWYVTKHTDKKLEAALSVFVDRIIGLTGLLIMAFGCYWFIPVQGRTERFEFSYDINLLQRIIQYRWVLIGIGAVLAIFIAALLWTVKGRVRLSRLSQLVRKHSADVLSKGRNAVRIYYGKKLAIACALLLTFCCQGVFVIGLWLMGREIGVKAHMKYYFIFFPISWLLGALPISVGGLGIMELWLKDIFIRVCAVSSKHAAALALCQRIIWLLGSLPGVVIHFIGAHLPKDFFIDYDKSIN